MNGRAVAAAAFFVLSAAQAFAASADFYPLAQRWVKSRAESSGKDEAVEGAFHQAARSESRAVADPFGEPPPAVKRSLSAFAPSGETIELENGQTLVLAADTPIAKFASTEEPIVELQTADPSTLLVVAREVGKTIVHVWDASRRTTFEVRVIPRKITGPTYLDMKRDEIQKTRPFKIRFTADGGGFESGDKFREMDRTSLEWTERVEVDGDTPYGRLRAHGQVQRSGVNTENELGDARVSLADGRIGQFKNFNVAAGDSVVKPDFLSFSRGRIRGVAGEQWTEDKRFQLSGFFGREQAGIFAPLSPTAIASKRSIDSFLSGTTADYRPSDDLKMRAGYFTGYGRSRPDELNRQGMALAGEAVLTPSLTFLPETDFDTEHVAHLHALRWKDDRAEVRTEFRSINENFQSMVGAPSQQGELGWRTDAFVRPWEKWRWMGRLDTFKDRRIPNPDMPGKHNIHAESELVYDLADRSSLAFTWRDWDDTGRISPTRERAFGLQYTESFEAFWRTISFNARAAHRRSRFLTQSSSNYDRNELSLGLFFPLAWDIRFSIQKEWHWLDDVNLPGRWSQPEVLTAGLGYSHRLWETPFYAELDFRYRDEEETESPNSFMAGEDSTEITAAFYYRESENLELYLKGQFQNFNAESLLLTGHRVEAQVLAGMRWDWDTGIRWSGVGQIRGSVFKDENRNGLRDPGESGLAKVKVESAAGYEAVTDADGRFEIRQITSRSAAFSVDASNLPAGYVPTSDVLRQVEIPVGEWVTLDFGFAPRSEVTGTVFNDLNRNGKLEPSEPGIARVRLKLDGKSQMSSGSGAYAFRGVPPGTHEIELDLSSVAEGYLPSGPTRKSLELAEGMRYEWNVPLDAYRVVSGRLFYDRDGNGTFSAPEDEPVSGAEVLLGTYRQASDEEGRFLFDRLPPGRYELFGGGSTPEVIQLGVEPETISGKDIALLKERSA